MSISAESPATREPANAMRSRPGDHAGVRCWPGPEVSWVSPVPSELIRWRWYRPALRLAKTIWYLFARLGTRLVLDPGPSARAEASGESRAHTVATGGGALGQAPGPRVRGMGRPGR